MFVVCFSLRFYCYFLHFFYLFLFVYFMTSLFIYFMFFVFIFFVLQLLLFFNFICYYFCFFFHCLALEFVCHVVVKWLKKKTTKPILFLRWNRKERWRSEKKWMKKKMKYLIVPFFGVWNFAASVWVDLIFSSNSHRYWLHYESWPCKEFLFLECLWQYMLLFGERNKNKTKTKSSFYILQVTIAAAICETFMTRRIEWK